MSNMEVMVEEEKKEEQPKIEEKKEGEMSAEKTNE